MADNPLLLLDNEDMAALIRARDGYNLASDELAFVLHVVTDFDYAGAWAKVYGVPADSHDNPYQLGKALSQQPNIAAAIVTELNFHGKALLINKAVLMSMMYREATNPKNKGSERIAAIRSLAQMTGDLDPDPNKGAPQVNIQINNNPGMQPQEGPIAPQVVVITPAMQKAQALKDQSGSPDA